MAAAWLVHLYTASGALCAFIATVRAFEGRFREAFFWLVVQVVIDATDGVLARAADVKTRTPHFNGAKLDDIVDYLAFVFVPAVIVWRAQLVPDHGTLIVAGAMLLSSAYGFNRDDAKTGDHFFTGFPSYWNIVVFYLWLMDTSPGFNAILLLVLAALVFVPIRYIYPSRTPILQMTTNVLGVIWGVLMLVLLWQAPDVTPAVLWGSLVFPAYYVAMSLALELKRR